jgi:uncharacterized membrane protein YqgA involved in biofilm formation
MKSKLVVKFLLALAFGSVLGEFIHLDHEKWLRLGREAFLTHQANQFDHDMIAPAVGVIVFCAIFALGIFTLYEGIAFAAVKLVSRALPPKTPAPGNLLINQP